MSLVTRAAMYLVRLVGKCVWKNTWWVYNVWGIISWYLSKIRGLPLPPQKKAKDLFCQLETLSWQSCFWRIERSPWDRPSWNESVVASWWPSNLDNSLFVWLWNVHSFWLVDSSYWGDTTSRLGPWNFDETEKSLTSPWIWCSFVWFYNDFFSGL